MPETRGPIAREVDCRGLLCPLPVLRARQALEELAVGAVILVVCTDPASKLDLEVYCATSGHDLLDVVKEDRELRFRIRKSSGRT